MAMPIQRRGILLYGPPASGKDTVTRALHAADARYRLFPHLKAGPGRTAGYQPTTAQHLDELREDGRLVWEISRYGATYAIERHELYRRIQREIPVVHVGDPRAIAPVMSAIPLSVWLVVELWAPEEVTKKRLDLRGDSDLLSRLCVYKNTPQLKEPDVFIDTSKASPAQSANTIIGVFS